MASILRHNPGDPQFHQWLRDRRIREMTEISIGLMERPWEATPATVNEMLAIAVRDKNPYVRMEALGNILTIMKLRDDLAAFVGGRVTDGLQNIAATDSDESIRDIAAKTLEITMGKKAEHEATAITPHAAPPPGHHSTKHTPAPHRPQHLPPPVAKPHGPAPQL